MHFKKTEEIDVDAILFQMSLHRYLWSARVHSWAENSFENEEHQACCLNFPESRQPANNSTVWPDYMHFD